jgi:ABC-type nickel/cobalt efflux system permease component RcnA
MMAAFIIAIKGTVRQAIMLGLAATVSHSYRVVDCLWGMYISNKFTAESAEPWLQFISASSFFPRLLDVLAYREGKRTGLREWGP